MLQLVLPCTGCPNGSGATAPQHCSFGQMRSDTVQQDPYGWYDLVNYVVVVAVTAG